MSEETLTREQVRNAVDRRGGDIPRVPLVWHKFYNGGTIAKYGDGLDALNHSIVDDCAHLYYIGPGNFQAPEGTPADYRWAIEDDPGDLDQRGFTSRLVVSTTELIDDFIEQIPDPSSEAHFQNVARAVDENPDRYCVGWDFFCLFERAWFLFGMENTLCEMMWRPDRYKRLMRAFTDYHKKVIDGYAAAGVQSYFTSDDLGTQKTLIFSRENFRELYLPFYEELVAHCHDRGLSFWLHSCGAITDVLDDLVGIGVDVIHPIQPVAMNQAEVARRYRGRVTFLAGIDVQYLLPTGSIEDVIQGTRDLIDAFDSAEGGCLLAASNGIMPETPLDNIRAWLETAERYGRQKRSSWRSKTS